MNGMETTFVEERFGDMVDEQVEHSATVGELASNVEQDVAKETDRLRQQFGGQISEVETAFRVKGTQYVRNVRSSLRTDFDIDQKRNPDFAAYNRKGTDNGIAVAGDMLSPDQVFDNAGYLQRLTIHELTHKNLQTATFNLGVIRMPEMQVSVVGDLTEWQAIREAKQRPEELTAGYVKHAQQGERLVAQIGSGGRQLLYEALKNGDMSKVQERVTAATDRRNPDAASRGRATAYSRVAGRSQR